jgi:hypothetical protein
MVVAHVAVFCGSGAVAASGITAREKAGRAVGDAAVTSRPNNVIHSFCSLLDVDAEAGVYTSMSAAQVLHLSRGNAVAVRLGGQLLGLACPVPTEDLQRLRTHAGGRGRIARNVQQPGDVTQGAGPKQR